MERQEPARALDGVNGSEDARQHLPGSGVLLEGDEIPVQLVQVLMALYQELLDDLAQFLHGLLLWICTDSIGGPTVHLRVPSDPLHTAVARPAARGIAEVPPRPRAPPA